MYLTHAKYGSMLYCNVSIPAQNRAHVTGVREASRATGRVAEASEAIHLYGHIHKLEVCQRNCIQPN